MDRTKMGQSKIPSPDFDPNVPHHPPATMANTLLNNGSIVTVENQPAPPGATVVTQIPVGGNSDTNTKSGTTPKTIKPWLTHPRQ